MDPADQEAARPGDDRPRRHAEQGPAGRERDPRRVAGGRQGRGGRGGAAAVALPGRRGGARAAGADDERAERRRARRQQGRLPGVHGRARSGAGSFSRRPPDGRGGLPRAQEDAPRPRALHGGRRRGRLRARPRLERGGAPGADRGHRGRGLPARRRHRHRARPRDERDLRGRRLQPRARGPHAQLSGPRRLLERHLLPLPGHLDRGRPRRGGLGRAGGCSPSSSATASSSWATTSS